MPRAYALTAQAIAAERARVGGDLTRMELSRVFQLEEVARRPMGPVDVRVRVIAVSIEHNVVHAALADTVNIVELRGGKIYPGNSFLGEIVEVGAGASQFLPGDIVVAGANPENDRYGFPMRAWAYDQPNSIGAYGEEIVVRENQVKAAPLDCGLSLWEIAAAPLRAASAYHLWRRGIGLFRVKVPRERLTRVNVLAFGGGVSELFLMLARAEGHRAFYCSGSAIRRERLSTLGIEPIDQAAFHRFASPADVRAFARTVKRLTGGIGMHVVCDMIRGPVFAAGLAASARGGVNVSSGWQLGTAVSYNSAALSLQQVTVDHVHFETPDGCAAALDLLGSVMRPQVHEEIYPFEDLPRAVDELHHNVPAGIPVVQVVAELPASVLPLAALPAPAAERLGA